jgi:serine/threonine-protein kinase
VTDEQGTERFADDARRYRLESRIATGGMGEVWRGTDTVLGRQVAIKLLKHEYADDESFRSRFETEARHAGALHHPGIAAVFDFGEGTVADGSGAARPFLVMELVDGQPLSALLRSDEPMDPDVARDLLAQAADAIGAAHAAGIIHRDVKPANLLVTPAREVKITDFGIARAAEGMALTQTGQVMGTPQYISPEQARGTTATPASDVYALGVVAFECLAGRRPFIADTPVATALAHLREPVPPLPPEVPADLAAVVRKAMSKEPGDRYPDGAAFAAALRDPATAATAIVPPPDTGSTQVLGAAAAGAVAGAAAGSAGASGVTPAPEPTTPADGKRSGRRRGALWLLLGALVVLAALVIGFVVLGSEGDQTPPPQTPTPKPTKTREPTTTPSETTQEPTSQAPTQTPTSTAPTTSAPTETTTTPTETTTPSPTETTTRARPPRPPTRPRRAPRAAASRPRPTTERPPADEQRSADRGRWTLRARRAPRPGRDGRGPQGHGHPARPGRGGQAAAHRPRQRRDVPGPVPP